MSNCLVVCGILPKAKSLLKYLSITVGGELRAQRTLRNERDKLGNISSTMTAFVYVDLTYQEFTVK